MQNLSTVAAGGGAAAAAACAPAAVQAAAGAAIGEALRAIRERVRCAALRCRSDSRSSSTSNGNSSPSQGSSGSTSDSKTFSSSSSNSRSNLSSSGDTCYAGDNNTLASKAPGGAGAPAAAAAPSAVNVRLVAVSKRQPAAAVAAAAACGQRHFAENYVQELISKYQTLVHLNLSWHMIGHLQSNKAKQLLAACPQLYMMETVDSIRLAHILDAAVAAVLPQRDHKPLRVLVQVNTSGEETKSGLKLVSGDESVAASPQKQAQQRQPGAQGQQQQPQGQQEEEQHDHPQQKRQQVHGEVMALVQCIVKECSHLRFAGLMTIGPPDLKGACRAFAALSTLKQQLLQALPAVQQLFESSRSQQSGLLPQLRDEKMNATKSNPLEDYVLDEREKIFELSMGMTSDFEEAIRAGSTEIRVGTAIFGSRR